MNYLSDQQEDPLNPMGKRPIGQQMGSDAPPSESPGPPQPQQPEQAKPWGPSITSSLPMPAQSGSQISGVQPQPSTNQPAQPMQSQIQQAAPLGSPQSPMQSPQQPHQQSMQQRGPQQRNRQYYGEQPQQPQVQ